MFALGLEASTALNSIPREGRMFDIYNSKEFLEKLAHQTPHTLTFPLGNVHFECCHALNSLLRELKFGVMPYKEGRPCHAKEIWLHAKCIHLEPS